MYRLDSRTPIVSNIQYFVKWTVISCIIGGIGGLIGTAFSFGISWASDFRQTRGWTLYLMPAAGLLIVWLYHRFHEDENRGTNIVLESISSTSDISAATGPLIFISTILTHFVGGSSGREGAALQIGGSFGNWLGKKLNLDEKDKKIAVMCGMSAVFAALFGTPVAAGIFSMEVISVGVIYYAALVPCLFASFIGAGISSAMGISPEAYTVQEIPAFTAGTGIFTVFLGILCAVVSMLLCVVLHQSQHLYRKYIPNPYLRIVAASALFIGLTLLIGTRDYMGSGTALIERAMEGKIGFEVFILKMVFTAIVLGAGFKGGEIVPTMCVGAAFGCTVGMISGFAPSLCAACGLAALFVGVTNCPVSSFLMALELFGMGAFPYYAIVIAVSFTLSGYYGLYSSQKFIYSKTRTEYINRKSH